MYKIVLINMPFAVLHIPSIALTQLKSIVEQELSDSVSVDLLYLNQDFATFMGLDAYLAVSKSHKSEVTGLGDWLFRQLAFPELTDNSEEYFRRYFPERDKVTETQKRVILDRWSHAEHFMDELIDKYQLAEKNLVGFTSMFSQNLACFAMARKLKERNPELITVMGGANCEWPMGREIAQHVKQVDYVFSGPALKSFPQFLRSCLDQNMEACGTIKGVIARAKTNGASGRGLPVLGETPKPILGDELPIDVDIKLDYEPFIENLKDRFPNGAVEPTLLFETSRGCWWGERAHCTFCGLNGLTMNYRAMNSDKAINLFQSLFKYSSTVRRLEAVDNIMPKNYPKEVISSLQTPQEMSIFYEVKADLKEEEMKVLSEGRVLEIQPGIEALATSTLKLMKKGTSAFQNLQFLKNCLVYGIFPQWNLLVGFPGEEEEIYKKYVVDLPRLTHLPPPSGVFPVRFDRFSPYFVQAEQYGLDLRALDYYSLIYPFDEQTLANLAYYFDDRNVNAPYRVKMTKWIDQMRTRVEYWKSRWSPDSKQVKPKLYMKGGPDSTVVYDSRSMKVIEHQVGPIGKRVLECLSTPKGTGGVAEALKDIPNVDAEREIALLQYRGLVFQEGPRFLSLVLAEEPTKEIHF